MVLKINKFDLIFLNTTVYVMENKKVQPVTILLVTIFIIQQWPKNTDPEGILFKIN